MSRNTFVLLVLGLLIALFLQFRPIDDLDLFWQVRSGWLLLEIGQLVPGDTFTYTHAGERVPPIAWLSQVLFALQLRWGGWSFVRLGTALALAGALSIAGLTRRRELGWFGLTTAVLLGLLVVLPHSSVRPQAFAALGFALLLALVQSPKAAWLRFLAAIPLLILWQNLHPSVIIAGIAVAARVAWHWLRFLAGLFGWIATRMDTNDAQPGNSVPWALTALLLLIGLCQFATPLGMSILALSQQNAVVSRDWLHVSEWMPPWDPSVRAAMSTFWLALLVSIVLLLRLRFRVAADDLVLFAVMTVLSLSAARFALFWAIAAVPLWARWIEAAKPAELFQSDPARTVPWLTAVPALCLGMLLVCALPLLAVAYEDLPIAVVSDQVPVEGVRRLETVRWVRRVYNYREWGGPLVFWWGPVAAAERWQIAIDGRLYMFTKEEWDEYRQAALGQIPLEQLVDKHRPDAFFLRPDFHAPLIAALRQSKDWEALYADALCAVFIRARSAGRDQ